MRIVDRCRWRLLARSMLIVLARETFFSLSEGAPNSTYSVPNSRDAAGAASRPQHDRERDGRVRRAPLSGPDRHGKTKGLPKR
eukprot:3833445-Prymnesium_polylepis.1